MLLWLLDRKRWNTYWCEVGPGSLLSLVFRWRLWSQCLLLLLRVLHVSRGWHWFLGEGWRSWPQRLIISTYIDKLWLLDAQNGSNPRCRLLHALVSLTHLVFVIVLQLMTQSLVNLLLVSVLLIEWRLLANHDTGWGHLSLWWQALLPERRTT